MFKKGDYIVCLNTPVRDTSFPRNYVFKQREDGDYLMVEMDVDRHINGWGMVKYDGSAKCSEWRYATSVEINRYELKGTPYDVTKIIPEKWSIKVTKDNSKTLGEYFGIMSDVYKDWQRSRDGIDFLNSHNKQNKPVSIRAFASFASNNPRFELITDEEFILYVLKNKPDVEDLTNLTNLLIKFNLT